MKAQEIPQKEYNHASAFWFKPVEFGHHTWAVAEEMGQGIRLFFFDVSKGVFDTLDYKSNIVMRKELQLNGFEKYEKEAIPVEEPHGSFHISEQAHRRVYSSGKFWKTLPERLKLKYEGNVE